MVTVGAGGTGGLFIPLVIQGVLLGRIVSTALDQAGLESATALWPVRVWRHSLLPAIARRSQR